jgi:hypothetical protein
VIHVAVCGLTGNGGVDRVTRTALLGMAFQVPGDPAGAPTTDGARARALRSDGRRLSLSCQCRTQCRQQNGRHRQLPARTDNRDEEFAVSIPIQ